MNRIYRLVWNRALRVLQVASEFAQSHDGGATGAGESPLRRRPLTLACALALGVALSATPQHAMAQTAGTSGGGASGATGGTGSTGSNAGGNGATSSGSGGAGGGAYGSGGQGGVRDGNTGGGSSTSGGGGGGIGYGYGAWNSGGGGGGGGGLGTAGIGGGGGGGSSGGTNGGGGGGGGGLGATYNGTATTSASITGGAGGIGANGGGGGSNAGGGGGGGGGGAGALLAASGSLTNTTTIAGGAGGAGGTAPYPASGGGGGGGGAGLLMGASSTLDNLGTIKGGNGGTGQQRIGGGGAGIYAAGGNTIDNHGTISGGLNGGGAGQYAAAILFNGTGSTLNLYAGSTINGALQLLGGSSATIAAQDSGLTLSSNIVLGSSSNVTLDTSTASFSVSGNVGGSGSVILQGSNRMTYTGTSTGPNWLAVSGSSLQVGNGTTAGSITGNTGSTGSGSNGTAGQAGTYGAGGTNGGTGGTGTAGGTGGAGATGRVAVTGYSGAILTVAAGGTVAGGLGGTGGGANGGAGGSGGSGGTGGGTYGNGGAGGNGSNGGVGGTGGDGSTGVSGTGFALTNAGSIAGGNGGAGGSANGGAGGNGGSTFPMPIIISNGVGGNGGNGGTGGTGGTGGNGGVGIDGSRFTLTNTGSITGGNGGAGGGASGGGAGVGYINPITLGYSGSNGSAGANGSHGGGGNGGAGVVSTGGSSITNAGSISGGLSGAGGTRADAVDLSGGGNTLTLESGYSFTGNVVSTSGSTNGGDTLALGGNGTTGTFDLTQIVTTLPTYQSGKVQYYGFANLAKTGTSTWIVTGGTTSTAAWTINGGTLQVGNGTTDGALGTGNIANNAALAFDNTADTTVAGNISGTGSLAQRGSGTLILTGINTYTGGTTISNGTLQVGNGTTDGALGTGNIANNAALVFDNTAGTTVAGNISGTGSLTLQGSGTLTLSGVNTYTGGTTISNGTLVFDQANDGTFSSAISGSGRFAKAGAGTLILDGNSGAFTGNTTVQAGTLEVGDAATPSAVLGGNVAVGSGGTLRGHGTIGGNVGNDGTVWAGGSIGTLTINGNYTQTAQGVLEVEATPDAQTSLLAISGTATLAGSALVLADSGNWAPRTDYTILTAASGVSGQFASASVNLAFLAPVLTYAPNAVTLSLERNDINFNSVVQTSNQRAVATAADPLGFGNPVYDALVVLDAATARRAFDQLSGEIHASTRTAIADNDHYVRDAINQHLAGQSNDADGLDVTDADGVTAWTAAWGHWGNHDGDGNASTLDDNGSGLLFGADMPVGGTARVGAVMGTGQGTARVDALGSSAHVIDQHLGIYGSTQTGALLWQGAAIYGWQKVDTNRPVDFGTFDGTAVSSYRAHTAQAYVDASLPFVQGSTTLAPFVNLAVERLGTPDVQENGTPMALDVAAQDSTLGYGTLGLRAAFDLGTPDHGLHAHASLGWQHAWGDTLPVDTMHFESGGDSFAIAGLPVLRNAGVFTTGLSFTVAPSVSVDGSYQGQFGQHTKDQSARISLDWKF
ncbi:autotransporter domain-containing protein [Rhodanobacter sp. Si-c]|uniref:Autotransporter domain-containing protein n=1 Tax=Rhodanobacter lycopersici TaxID=3162487 RepID=A0ABV3QI01_9GAMM